MRMAAVHLQYANKNLRLARKGMYVSAPWNAVYAVSPPVLPVKYGQDAKLCAHYKFLPSDRRKSTLRAGDAAKQTYPLMGTMESSSSS